MFKVDQKYRIINPSALCIDRLFTKGDVVTIVNTMNEDTVGEFLSPSGENYLRLWDECIDCKWVELVEDINEGGNSMTIDFNSNFKVVVDDYTTEFNVPTWQMALEEFMDALSEGGFEIDEKLKKAIIELAKMRKVTI